MGELIFFHTPLIYKGVWKNNNSPKYCMWRCAGTTEQSCNFFTKWNLNSQKIGKNTKNSKNFKKIKNEAGAMYCLIYIFFRFYFWRFHVQKNIFLNFAQFLKSPWDSGTPRVWVYHEKFNIGFFAQTFGGSSYTCIEARKKFWAKKSMLNFSR